MREATKGRFLLIALFSFIWAGYLYTYNEQNHSIVEERIEACLEPMPTCNCSKAKQQQREHDSDETPLVNQMNKSNNVSFFYYNPQKFVDVFADCLEDKTCHVYYHHAKKTGGSTLGYVLSNIVGYEVFNNDDWCCGNFLQRLSAFPKQMCNLPFVPAEITGAQFQKLIQTCMEHLTEQRAIVLTSIREPIHRTISLMNQKCNKNCREGKCSSALTAACQRCQYESDKPVWDSFVRDTNTMFSEIQRIHQIKLPNVKVLSIDILDIADFFARLSHSIPFENANVVRNPEKADYCDFAMTSTLFRNLAPSQVIYRNITMSLQR